MYYYYYRKESVYRTDLWAAEVLYCGKTKFAFIHYSILCLGVYFSFLRLGVMEFSSFCHETCELVLNALGGG